MKQRSFVLFNSSGCLLPFLLIFNLFFGLFFLKAVYWALLEVILIVLFLWSSTIMAKKIIFSVKEPKRRDAIDVEGEIVEDKEDRRKLAN